MIVLLYIWQILQNLIGLFYKTFFAEACLHITEDYEIYIHSSRGGVALGRYIFISDNASNTTIRHEIGHVKQSIMLGPLYLFIIGIPSILWAGSRRFIPALRKYNYYSFYTEKWANKLAGIE